VNKIARHSKKVRNSNEDKFAEPSWSWFSPLIILLAIKAGFQVRRLIPFASILLVCECAFLMRRFQRPSNDQGFLGQLESCFYDLFTPTFVNCLAIIGVVAVLGAYLVSHIWPPVVPQGSAVFKPPFKAISYLNDHLPPGKVFNDPQYGDLLIWYLPQKVPVFIDSRFDMYGPKLVLDFQIIYNCRKGFENLLRAYAFDWSFLPAKSKLAQYLRAQQDWREIYSDEAASIFLRHADASKSQPVDQPNYDQSHSQ
jgi:hypothetical protein